MDEHLGYTTYLSVCLIMFVRMKEVEIRDVLLVLQQQHMVSLHEAGAVAYKARIRQVRIKQ